MFSENPATRIALAVVPMVLSLTFHEFAHAFTAHRLGDSTAKDANRLTLNPLAHIDVVGTLIIPALTSFLWGFALIGWARPTPIRQDRLRPIRHRWVGLLLAAVAGPVANLLLSGAAAALLVLFQRYHLYGNPFESQAAIPGFVSQMFVLNLSLAIFHLLPIPPLDGGRLLPKFLGFITEPLERFGWILLVAFAIFPLFAAILVFIPLNFLLDHVTDLFGLPPYPNQ